MRKLIESALVSLDGVIEAPWLWANFDAEDKQRTRLSQLTEALSAPRGP